MEYDREMNRDTVLQMLSSSLRKTELEDNKDIHHFANKVFNEMLNRLVKLETMK